MHYVRNWFTGELEEMPSEGGGRQIIAATSVPESAVVKRNGSTWGRPWRSKAAAVPAEQAAEFNAGAALGARYVQGDNGFWDLECDSRAARRNEMARRGLIDRDAGYSDAQ